MLEYPQAFQQKISMKPDFRYFASELFIKFNFAYIKSNCRIPSYDRFYFTNSKHPLIFNVMNLNRFNCATENIFIFVPSLGNCAATTSRPKFSGLQVIATQKFHYILSILHGKPLHGLQKKNSNNHNTFMVTTHKRIID